MQIGSISGFIRPIQKKWITTDIVLGAVLGKAKSFYLKGIDYEYNINENRFTYLFKDYQLAKEESFWISGWGRCFILFFKKNRVTT